jgi:predicted metalloprotease with PDZ domain
LPNTRLPTPHLGTVILLSLAAISTSGSTAVQRLVTGPSQYVLTVRSANPTVTEVEASLAVTDDILEMDEGYAEHLPDRWAKFVHGLSARDTAGRSIALQYLGAAKWRIPAPRPSVIRLTYRVTLDHDKEDWPFGAKEAAYRKPDWYFYTSRTLFIGNAHLSGVSVQFRLPASWTVTTPWTEVAGARNTFRVPNFDELTNVALVMGKYATRTVRSGESQVTIALGRDLADALDVFERTARSLLPAATNVFGGAPAGTFVVLANRATYSSGGAFIRSVSMVFKDPPTAASRVELGQFLGHELVHLWLGNAVRAAEVEQEYWLSEGFTDYLSYRLLVDVGLMSRADLAGVFETQNQKYLKHAGERSLRAAGLEKDKNYDLVYSGGFMVAVAIDSDIRRESNKVRDLYSMVREMYREFGTSGRRYTFDDVVRIAERMSGSPKVSALLRDCVAGQQILDTRSYLNNP